MNGAGLASAGDDVDTTAVHARIPLALLYEDAGWIEEAALPASDATSAQTRALLSRGLLTDALATRYRVAVQVRRVQHAEVSTPGAIDGLRRDVVISAGTRVCALASTLMPGEVLAANPWLRHLGNRALGESLAERVRVHRDAYQFRRLAACESPWPGDGDTPCIWARRYRFVLDAGALVVAESFAPDVLEDLGQR